MMTQQPSSLPTRGQLERRLSQQIQALYRQYLGHQPSKVICQLFDDTLAIVVEDAITLPEQRLVESDGDSLAETVHTMLDESIRPQLQEAIEAILGVAVIDLLSDATLETGRVGAIAVLSEPPQVRNPQAVPKVKRSE